MNFWVLMLGLWVLFSAIGVGIALLMEHSDEIGHDFDDDAN